MYSIEYLFQSHMEEKKYAMLSDLILEKWFRLRKEDRLLWKTKDGQEIPIGKMTDQHLNNAIECMHKLYDTNTDDILETI